MLPVSGGMGGRTPMVSGRRRIVSGRVRAVSRGRVTGGNAKMALSRLRREAAVSRGSGRGGGPYGDGTAGFEPGMRVMVSVPGRGGPPIGYGDAGYVFGGYVLGG